MISATLTLSLRCTVTSAPSAPEAMHQVPGETVVIVDQRDGCHGRVSVSSSAVLGRVRSEVKTNEQ